MVHSDEIRFVCYTVIEFYRKIDILFGLDYQLTHSCLFDPSNFRVYDRLAKEAICLDCKINRDLWEQLFFNSF